MRELTLYEKVHIWMGKMASRSDVKVENSSYNQGDRLGKWQDDLPEDLLPF